MNETKCIDCGTEIKFSQLLKHSWKNPIVCTSCGAKLNFDKKEWNKAVIPAFIVNIALVVVVLIGSSLPREIAITLLLSGIFLLLVASIWFGMKIMHMKFVQANKT